MSPNGDIRLVGDIPRVLARARGEEPALIEGDLSQSFAELARNAEGAARGLRELGLRPGDRVAVLAKDSAELLELCFGIARARGVFLGINWRLAEAEIRFLLEDSEAELLFVGPEQLELASRLAAALPQELRILTLGRARGAAPTGASESYASMRDRGLGLDPLPEEEVSEEEIFAQIYTSGTTGLPKGVQLAHRSFFAVVRELKRAGDPWIGWSPEDVSLHCIPSFHIGGLWWAMTSLAAGASLVIMESWAAHEALRLLEEEGVTKVCMVPAMMQMLLLEPGCAEADFSALTHIVYGGSPITAALLEEARATFGCRFAQIYGLTETGNTAICLRPEDHEGGRPELLKAAGRPYPGVALKCVDPEGRELSPGEIGEVCVRSPANMVGYFRRPEATAETLREGWIHTGDAGYLDEEGYLYICDRIKDMIIYAGENVYPAEVESALAGHPAVAEVGVIGVPDERWGERVHAVVVLRSGGGAGEGGARPQLSAAELIAHARERLAEFKVPKSVSFAEALPRTPSGKIKKGLLRAPYWEGRERQVN